MYSNDFGGLLAVLGGFLFLFVALAIAFLVVYIIGLVKVFQKNGRAGWEAIIPFYNSWVLVEISGLAWWWFLIINAGLVFSILDIEGLTSLAGLVTLFGNFCCFYNLSKKLHKDVGFAVLTTLFSFIMIPVIGFSSQYQFDNNVKVSDVGPFGKDVNSNNNNETKSETVPDNTDTKKRFCPKCGCQVLDEHEYCKNCGEKLK